MLPSENGKPHTIPCFPLPTFFCHQPSTIFPPLSRQIQHSSKTTFTPLTIASVKQSILPSTSPDPSSPSASRILNLETSMAITARSSMRARLRPIQPNGPVFRYFMAETKESGGLEGNRNVPREKGAKALRDLIRSGCEDQRSGRKVLGLV